MTEYSFKSVLAPHFLNYLKMKQALGYRAMDHIVYVLRELDHIAIAKAIREPVVTKGLFMEWKESRITDSERTIYHKCSDIRQFAIYMEHNGIHGYIPRIPRCKHWRYIPYIFSHEEVSRLFAMADKLTVAFLSPKLCLFSIPTIVRLLYATGMRIGEVLFLDNKDVNLQQDYILIRQTKNRFHRMIPLSPSTKALLTQYLQFRQKVGITDVDKLDSPFFITNDGHRVGRNGVYGWFRKLLTKCDIPHTGKGPRIHDLRHTFAAHSLMKQSKEGKDLYCCLPILSVFLGHKSVEATEAYVRMTAEMLPELSWLIEKTSGHVFPNIKCEYNDEE